MRDPGHPFRFYQSIYFAEKQLPRVFLTGAHLDAYPGIYIQQAVLIRDHDHAREMVRNYVEQGATGIKIYSRLPLKYYETIINMADFYHIPVMAGMTPLEVISSSTIHNANYFRSADRIGSIESGKLADLLLVDGNPDFDISNMYQIHKVMLNGQWVE